MKYGADKVITSWCADQVVSILAVDNISISKFAQNLLNQRVHGEITAEQAREAILERAQSYASAPSKAANLGR